MKEYSTIGQKLREFNKKFEHAVDAPLSYETLNLWANLIREEYSEVMQAVDELEPVADAQLAFPNMDLEDIKKERSAHLLKELCDLIYVATGLAVAFGWDIDTAFTAVHKSNMSKLWEDGKVHKNEAGKVMKPPTYKKPDMEPYV